MRRLSELALVAVAVFGLGCPPIEEPTDGGVDAGPEVCVNFPDRFPADVTVAKGCYLALKTPVISPAVTITLQPGVKIIFSSEVGLTISADQVLQAVGTQAEPIILTGAMPTRGFWKGLSFEGTSTASTLDWVTVEYAGNVRADAQAAAVKLIADSRGVRLAMSHSTLRHSAGWGFHAGGSAVISAFAQNTLTLNTLGPASLDAEVVGVLDGASTFAGNDVDQLHVRGMRVSQSATWPELDVPYFVTSNLALAVADLTLAPGARLVMGPGAGFGISGDTAALIAAGTAEKPIVFTGATATRGAWRGLRFDGSNNTRNVLRYVTVEWAGDTTADFDAAAVKLTGDSHGVQLRLEHVTLRQSEAWGLYLAISAVVPEFTANVLTENTLGPAKVASNAAHQLLTTSTFVGNDVDKVLIYGDQVLSAVTWPGLDVPYLISSRIDPELVWTLAPGVTLEMMPQTSIVVSGDASGFHAVGTAALPILITGSVKTRGSWDSISFDTTLNGANAFEHCTIEYGGGGARFGWAGMIIARADSHGVNVSVTNSTVQHSQQYGIWLGSTATGSVSGNTYADNASGDFFQEP